MQIQKQAQIILSDEDNTRLGRGGRHTQKLVIFDVVHPQEKSLHNKNSS